MVRFPVLRCHSQDGFCSCLARRGRLLLSAPGGLGWEVGLGGLCMCPRQRAGFPKRGVPVSLLWGPVPPDRQAPSPEPDAWLVTVGTRCLPRPHRGRGLHGRPLRGLQRAGVCHLGHQVRPGCRLSQLGVREPWGSLLGVGVGDTGSGPELSQGSRPDRSSHSFPGLKL